jgi:tRNA1(Val) A37 N6-methylase TrmN6|tara:strand:- start:88 stop:744 length:657 start_codon:yes stop_codon:yes gene_type:complete
LVIGKLRNTEIVEVRVDKFLVYTSNKLDGYGYQTAADAVSCINHFSNGRIYNHCLEWCAGPGYLGFGTLSQGLTKNLTLLDIHEPNKIVVEKTIDKNNLNDNVNFILSDNFKNHNTDVKYDLIIGNPPHFTFSPTYGNIDPNEHRKFKDENWNIHKDFFKTVSNHITDDADIILMENTKGSNLDTFAKMIESNGLRIENYCLSVTYPDNIWYVHIKKS